MMSSDRSVIKAMIELSDTWEDADQIVEEFAGIKDLSGKLAYISKMFNASVVGRMAGGDNPEKYDYVAMMSAIVNKKWR
jgi:hypothetical protein